MALEKAPMPSNEAQSLATDPCETTFYLDSRQIMEQRWYKPFGSEPSYLLHRDTAPARVEYYEDGTVRREDWCQAGKYHQTEKPAVTVYHADGTPKFEWWFVADEAHRLNGPAYIYHHQDGSRLERWYQHNQRHRTDGPAVIERAGDGAIRKAEWWLAGKDITAAAEEFLADQGLGWPFDRAQEATFLERILRRAA